VTELAVVTGAQGALGRAVVAEFRAQGWTVAALARRAEDVHDDGVHPIEVDLADRTAVHEAFARVDQVGRTGALVNVAGGWAPGGLAEVDEESLAAQIQINVSTALWSCQAAAARLSASGGAIVNVGARGAVTGGADPVAYSLSKSAVVRLTGLLSDQFKDSRVRVNAVLPLLMDTAANRANLPASALSKAVPVEAVAKVIAFLCGPDGWPVNGAIIPVYGFA
jgi:NAD(P)-dependent dehydrogenase (short-subunit alcohol dehydrogenase family)